MPSRATMSLGEAVEIAAASLWTHKLRSILTLLGVVIGVTSVIAVVSFINGLNSYVAEKVFNLGADVFVANRGPIIATTIDDVLETEKRKKFTFEDYEAVRDACRSCAEVGAATRNPSAEIKYGTNYLRDSFLRGWTPSMPRIYDVELTAGRHITDADLRAAARVCTVGWDIVDHLFVATDPIGKEIRVDGEPCEVIGIGKKLGSALGQSRDNWVIMPFTLVRKNYGSRDDIRIWGKSRGTENLQATIDEVRQILRARRHVPYSTKDDFAIETSKSFLSLWAGISSAFFGVVVAIASVSLVVGGIVIMNIMLVSVTERTREIGLRKSVGARRADILLQFLIESSTISAIGGFWGVLFGILLAKFVSWVTPLPSDIQLWPIIAGLLMATSVGLFFGIYPASKAARLDPVVALRAE